MKNTILLTAFLFLWAGLAKSAELPPYSDYYTFEPFFLEQAQQPESGIQMFPNPVTEGRLTIKSEESFILIQILNITGEIVFNQEYPSGSNSEVLELNDLEKGMYLVRIGFSGKPNHTGKIIVK